MFQSLLPSAATSFFLEGVGGILAINTVFTHIQACVLILSTHTDTLHIYSGSTGKGRGLMWVAIETTLLQVGAKDDKEVVMKYHVQNISDDAF